MFFNFFFQYKYFLKKFKKHYGKRFSKLFYKCKILKSLEKRRMLWLLKKKFLSIIGTNMSKGLKKKIFFSFLKKFNFKKKFFFYRNYYKLNSLSLIHNNLLKKKSSKLLKKKIKEYRILKKLKTFYYNPDTKKTKQVVYNRFKKKVLYKFEKKKRRRIKSIYSGLTFNLFTYNFRNRYKNRMKELELKKKSTPLYYFFKKKKNNYFIINRNIIKVPYNKLAYTLTQVNKLNLKLKEPYYFYFKKKKYKLLRCFDFIKKEKFSKKTQKY
jgi:hypothetical protein